MLASLLVGIAFNGWADNDSFILDNVSINGLEGLQSDVVKSRIGYKKVAISPQKIQTRLLITFMVLDFSIVSIYTVKGVIFLLTSKKDRL